MFRRWRSLFLLLNLAFTQVCLAQANKVPEDGRLNAGVRVESASLLETLRQIHRQTGLDFIADGATADSDAGFAFTGPAAEAIRRLSDTYGYSWEIVPTGQVLLRRTFKNPADYPQLNAPEWVKMARDVTAVLTTMPGLTIPNSMFEMTDALYASLTEAQVARLRDKKFIHASEFTQEQCSLVNRLNVYQKFYRLPQPWQHYEEFLRAIPGARMRLDKIPSTPDGYVLTIKVTSPKLGELGFELCRKERPEHSETHSGSGVHPAPDSPSAASEKGFQTIARTVARLQERLGERIDTDECLRARKVIVVAGDRNPRDVLRGLAQIHGWELARIAENRLLLRRFRIAGSTGKAPQDFARMRSAVPMDMQSYAKYNESLDALFSSNIDYLLKGGSQLDASRRTIGSAKKNALFDKMYLVRRQTNERRLKDLSAMDREDLLYLLLIDHGEHPWSDKGLQNMLPPHFTDVRQTALELWPGNMLLRGFERTGSDGLPEFVGDGVPFSSGIRP